MSFSVGGLIAIGLKDGKIKLIDILNGDELEIGHHDKKVSELNFSSDGKYLVSSGEDNYIYIWDAHNFKILKKIIYYHTTYCFSKFSPDSKMLVFGASG